MADWSSQHDEVLARLLRELARDDEPGLAAGVRHAGSTVALACRGLADLEARRPITPDTVFCVGSLAKPVSAVAVLEAAREGSLQLEDPITRHVASYAPPRAPTVAQLLSHTGGVPNYVTGPAFAALRDAPRLALADVLGTFAALPLDFEPGTRYGYSNSGYRLLEAALEAADAAPFHEVVAARVLRPLGMANAGVLGHDVPASRRAFGYARAEGGWVRTEPRSWVLAGAAGAIGCSLRDWLALDAAIFDDGRLDPAVQRAMTSPTRLASGRTEGIGQGWVLTSWRGSRVVTFAGGFPGYSSVYVRLVDLDLSVTILTNRDVERAAELARRLLGSLVASAAEVPTTSEEPEATWAGTYRDTLSSRELTRLDGRWRLADAPGTRRFIATGPTSLTDADDPDVSVELHDESPRALTVRWPFSWFTGYRY